jgi:RNA polymerase sigma-70 factor (ECF subfamily)
MIARLAEPYRMAIELTSQQGLTQTEAAKRAGTSVSGMKSRVQRARRRLRQMLLRCCAVDVDRRGGVSDYHLRQTTDCRRSHEQAAGSGCQPAGCSSGRQSEVASNRR